MSRRSYCHAVPIVTLDLLGKRSHREIVDCCLKCCLKSMGLSGNNAPIDCLLPCRIPFSSPPPPSPRSPPSLAHMSLIRTRNAARRRSYNITKSDGKAGAAMGNAGLEKVADGLTSPHCKITHLELRGSSSTPLSLILSLRNAKSRTWSFEARRLPPSPSFLVAALQNHAPGASRLVVYPSLPHS